MKFIAHNAVARVAEGHRKRPRYWWLVLEEKYGMHEPGVYLVEWSDRNDCLCFASLQKEPDGFVAGSDCRIKDTAKVSELTEANWPGSFTCGDLKKAIDEEIKTDVATAASIFLLVRRARMAMPWAESRELTESLIKMLYEENNHEYRYSYVLNAFRTFNEGFTRKKTHE
jgi:hypothetical protein